MFYATGMVTLDFYQNQDDALRRKKMEELAKNIRKKFNISCADVSHAMELEICKLAFTVTFPLFWKEEKQKQYIRSILETIDQEAFARVIAEEWNIYPFEEK